MTTAAPAQRTRPSYPNYRHHPYATNTHAPRSSGPKWHTANGGGPSSTSPLLSHTQHQTNGHAGSKEPPSPPRSRRDQSETPSLGLGVAFGGSNGGKWWDEELPPPPASLSSIIDSFRRSGQGDRDLLLSILGAKKAEEERLTALIQTRLTILHARLSIHSAAASLSYTPLTPPTESAPSDKLAPFALDKQSPKTSSKSPFQSSTKGPMSPPDLPFMPPPLLPTQVTTERAASVAHGTTSTVSSERGYFHLLPPAAILSRSNSNSPKLNANANMNAGHRHQHSHRLPPIKMGQRDCCPRGYPRRSTSPHSSGREGSRVPGFDMLLDAGMEWERRDGVNRD